MPNKIKCKVSVGEKRDSSMPIEYWEELEEKIGHDIYPGTLNLIVCNEEDEIPINDYEYVYDEFRIKKGKIVFKNKSIDVYVGFAGFEKIFLYYIFSDVKLRREYQIKTDEIVELII